LDLFGSLASELEEPWLWLPLGRHIIFTNINIVNTPYRFESVSLVMSEEEEAGYCDECGVDGVYYAKTTRELQEKLEQAQLQNSLLEKECDRLRGELREAKWNGFSR
jgi:hypothetical protein